MTGVMERRHINAAKNHPDVVGNVSRYLEVERWHWFSTPMHLFMVIRFPAA